ncbi:MAG: cell division protein SepF [Oscillospiraceae bacterium]|nr:cell division protein SepF [Oscillospiraceae bacterium]
MGSIWDNIANIIRGRRNDEEYEEIEVGLDTGSDSALKKPESQFDAFDLGIESSRKVMRLAGKESRTYKVVKIKGSTLNDYNLKRKEAADFFKEGHVVIINMEEAGKAIVSPVVDLLWGVAYALNGNLGRINTNTYAMIPFGDDMDGDLFHKESKSEYSVDSIFDIH